MWVSPRLISYQSRHIKSTLWDYAEWPPAPITSEDLHWQQTSPQLCFWASLWTPDFWGFHLCVSSAEPLKGYLLGVISHLGIFVEGFFFSRYLLYIILRAQISEDFLLLLAKDNWSLLLSLVCKSHDTQGSCLALGLFFHKTEVPFKSLWFNCFLSVRHK